MSDDSTASLPCTIKDSFIRTISIRLEKINLLDSSLKFSRLIDVDDLPGTWTRPSGSEIKVAGVVLRNQPLFPTNVDNLSFLPISSTDIDNISPDQPRVCFTFPRPETSSNLRLFVPRDLLRQASPVFVDLIDSGFAESDTSSGRKRPRTAKTVRKADYADSDDELDDYYASNPALLSSAPLPKDCHEVVITEAAYATYRNVLSYLMSGLIIFAPRDPATVETSRLDHLKEHAEDLELDMLASSPKSVYRLAHYLDLPDLQSLARIHYRSSLRAATVGRELVHPVVLLYEPLQKEVVSYIVEHFAEVEKTEEYKSVMARITNGEVATAGPVLVALLAAQREKLAKGAV
ncbi:hypothetical protein JCM8097_004415 [Rhodosporidiobolus ruineniae]